MRWLSFRAPEQSDGHDYDVRQIVVTCAAHGYFITSADARAAWQDFSNLMAAGWMMLPGDDTELFQIVRSRCDVTEDM